LFFSDFGVNARLGQADVTLTDHHTCEREGKMSDLNHKVAIVTDSIASMTQEMGREYGVHVVPIHISFGEQSYCDDIDLDAASFYHKLAQNSRLPTTSQPTALDFQQAYAQVARKAEAIVSIHASQKVSATVDSARSASLQMPDLPIYVIDTETLSMGQGLIVIAAARAAAQGKSAEEIVELVEDLIPKVRVLFTVETLEYLHRGGRIGGATAFLGTALKIKPVLHIDDGRVEPLEKPRTRKRAVARLSELMEEQVGVEQPIHAAVLHCNAQEEAEAFAERIRARFNCLELTIAEAGPTIGTHGGPGTLGITFYPA
jgi:DegV family protein with EDD domain